MAKKKLKSSVKAKSKSKKKVSSKKKVLKARRSGAKKPGKAAPKKELGTSTDELPVSAIDNGLETQGEEVHASDDAHEPAYEQDAEEFDTDDDTIGNA